MVPFVFRVEGKAARRDVISTWLKLPTVMKLPNHSKTTSNFSVLSTDTWLVTCSCACSHGIRRKAEVSTERWSIADRQEIVQQNVQKLQMVCVHRNAVEHRFFGGRVLRLTRVFQLRTFQENDSVVSKTLRRRASGICRQNSVSLHSFPSLRKRVPVKRTFQRRKLRQIQTKFCDRGGRRSMWHAKMWKNVLFFWDRVLIWQICWPSNVSDWQALFFRWALFWLLGNNDKRLQIITCRTDSGHLVFPCEGCGEWCMSAQVGFCWNLKARRYLCDMSWDLICVLLASCA